MAADRRPAADRRKPADRRPERADAARNRRAILAATEKLLATRPARDISMDQVAAEAGVGKGTIFHRFGSRTGLMRALMYERARELSDALTDGEPPLGPGADDRTRLFAFLDAALSLVARNKSLLAELSYASAAEPRNAEPRNAEPGTAGSRPERADPESRPERAAPQPEDGKPGVYSVWHRHLRTLLAGQRPDIDAGLTAHLILGSLHSEPVMARLTGDGAGGETGDDPPGAAGDDPAGNGAAEVAAAVRTMVRSILDAPRAPEDDPGRRTAGT